MNHTVLSKASMYYIAGSKLTWRSENQHDSKISNMAGLFSYMAASESTWRVFLSTWRWFSLAGQLFSFRSNSV